MGYKIFEVESEKMEDIKDQVKDMLMIGGNIMSALEECCDDVEAGHAGMRRGMRRGGGMMGRRAGGNYSGVDMGNGRSGMRYGRERDWETEY